MSGSHHKRWPPSASERWSECTASVLLLQDVPDGPSNKYAAEGTVAHDVLATLLETGDFEGFDVGTVHHVDGFDVEVDKNMHDSAITARDYIESHLGDSHSDRLVECRVTINLPVYEDDSVTIAVTHETSGTADAHGMPPESNTLHVFDYKYGRGVPVLAEGNTQLALYAMGVLDTYEFYWDRPITEVAMHISQPRNFEARKQDPWVVSVSELNELRMRLALRAHESLNDPQFRPEADTVCRWCALKGSCTALADKQMKVIGDLFDDEETPVEKAEGERLASIVRMAPGLRSWLDAVAAEALKRLESDPASVPGFKLVSGRRGTRRWSNPEDVERILTASKAGEAMWKKTLATPTQAEKNLSAGRWERVKDFVEQPPGKPVVAPEEDPRPAINVGFDDEDAGLLD